MKRRSFFAFLAGAAATPVLAKLPMPAPEHVGWFGNVAASNPSALSEAFSMALAERSAGYADIVTNSNALLSVMRERGRVVEWDGSEWRDDADDYD